MTTLQIICLIGAYISYSRFIMSVFIRKEGDEFTGPIKKMTVQFNEKLYEQYQNKKISAGQYQRSKRNVDTEIRKAKRVNMFVSPVLALPITLTLTLRYMIGD